MTDAVGFRSLTRFRASITGLFDKEFADTNQ